MQKLAGDNELLVRMKILKQINMSFCSVRNTGDCSLSFAQEFISIIRGDHLYMQLIGWAKVRQQFHYI